MDPYNNFMDFCKMVGIPAHAHTYNNGIQGMRADMMIIDDFPSDICTTQRPPATKKCGFGQSIAKKEEVTPMASYASATVVNPASIESDQRQIVVSTLRATREKLGTALRKQFGLTDDEAPKTPAEFIKRITDGQYTIDKDYLDTEVWSASGAANYIRWRDPAKVEDKAGYKVASEKLGEAYADAKLKAALLPVADLLKLVDDFKAFTA